MKQYVKCATDFEEYNSMLKDEVDYCLEQIQYADNEMEVMIDSINYASDDAGDKNFAFIREDLFDDIRAEIDSMTNEVNRLEKEYNNLKDEAEG